MHRAKGLEFMAVAMNDGLVPNVVAVRSAPDEAGKEEILIRSGCSFTSQLRGPRRGCSSHLLANLLRSLAHYGARLVLDNLDPRAENAIYTRLADVKALADCSGA